MKARIISGLRTVTGLAICAIAALTAALLARGTPASIVLPWAFAGVLIALASRFGAQISVLGSLIAAFVFARRLYAPYGSIQVHDSAEKAALAWMTLIAVVGSYLLFPANPERPHRR